jgi:hypothetical protein
VGSVFHHGDYVYTLRNDRCGHTLTVAAPRRDLEQAAKTHYASCQECTRPLRWVCPACVLVLSSSTVTADEDPATGRIIARCNTLRCGRLGLSHSCSKPRRSHACAPGSRAPSCPSVPCGNRTECAQALGLVAQESARSTTGYKDPAERPCESPSHGAKVQNDGHDHHGDCAGPGHGGTVHICGRRPGGRPGPDPPGFLIAGQRERLAFLKRARELPQSQRQGRLRRQD